MLTAVGAVRGVQMDWSWTLRNSCKNLYGSLWESSSSHQKDHPPLPPNPIASKIVRFLNPSMPKCFFSTHALSNIHHQQFLHLGLGTCFLEKRSGFPDVSLSVSQLRFPKRQGLMFFFSWPVSSLWQHRCHIFALCCETCPEACLQRVHPTWLKEVVDKIVGIWGWGHLVSSHRIFLMVAMVFCHLKISHYSWKLAE